MDNSLAKNKKISLLVKKNDNARSKNKQNGTTILLLVKDASTAKNWFIVVGQKSRQFKK